ncbi:MAG: F0F1 ATP synthase subunit alpha [Bacilli bacterium]|jgi:F-type H+-transporting ATPase subunit alpha|nr:F0F1 ATP synthase subunit alpha [Clostridium sp.]MDY3798431.1 F0F1 ATP synthase subunit alpha [Bacilli bacterium]CDE95045.1 aTP synthase subunit alpha [Clostridium sp. CAG:914]
MDDIWTNNLNDTIDSIKNNNNIYTQGNVIKVNEYNVEITGLDDVSFYEEVNIADKATGYVFGIYPDRVIVSLVKIDSEVKPGDMAYALKKEFKCLFSLDSVGKVIDIFGNDLIAGKRFDNLIELSIENPPIPLMDRGPVKRELLTGITGIDLIYPIGKGQRQLIIGDKKTGKTQIVLDAIVNQKDKNVLCIYVALGKTKKEVKDIYYELTKRGAASYTIIVASFHDELPTRTYLTPYVALSIAESFMLQSYDVLVCIDDLKKHADVYRQISLSSKKTPGRDAYPSDIFYTHSRLLEKGCQHKNGGSITILPIVETKAGDITDYISTNIISITDGQIVLNAKNFTKGEKPAIDYGLSVSRLGGNVQTEDMKKVGSKVRINLLSYLDVREIYELANIDEMSVELQNRLKEGQRILDNLRQYKFSPKTKQEMLDSYKFISEKE